MNNLNKICPFCKNQFKAKRKEHVCCSIKCAKKWGAIRGRNNADYRKEIECEYCHKKVLKARKILRKNKHFFCSYQCYWVFKKEDMKGKNNPNYRHGDFKLTCPTCGKIFYNRRKEVRFCSLRCSKTINLFGKGKRYERKAKKDLIKMGYIVIISTGSRTEADLVAINRKKIILLQIKSTNNITTKINQLFKKEINKLKVMQTPKNIEKQFWVWRHRIGWEKILLS